MTIKWWIYCMVYWIYIRHNIMWLLLIRFTMLWVIFSKWSRSFIHVSDMTWLYNKVLKQTGPCNRGPGYGKHMANKHTFGENVLLQTIQYVARSTAVGIRYVLYRTYALTACMKVLHIWSIFMLMYCTVHRSKYKRRVI